eukprot:1187406-Rhodomonas_salina.2
MKHQPRAEPVIHDSRAGDVASGWRVTSSGRLSTQRHHVCIGRVVRAEEPVCDGACLRGLTCHRRPCHGGRPHANAHTVYGSHPVGVTLAVGEPRIRVAHGS